MGYLVAGYPDRKSSLRIFRNCCAAGLDILEIGFPARDASLDGDVIRKAQARAEQSVAQDIDYWRAVRSAVPTPIWIMGYQQDLLEGDMYLRLAREGLYNALVIPDATLAEQENIRQRLAAYGVSVVGFINSRMDRAEVERVLTDTDLIYHQLYCGPTGVTHNDSGYLPLYRYARAHSKAKIYAGFGINSAQRVQELLRHGYDGAIIGSAIVSHLLENEQRVYRFIRDIRHSMENIHNAEACL